MNPNHRTANHLCDPTRLRAETRRTQGHPVPRGGFHKAGEGPAFGGSLVTFCPVRKLPQRSVPGWGAGFCLRNGRRAIYHNRTQKSRRSVSLRRHRLSKNPCFHEAKTGVLVVFWGTIANMMRKMEFSQLHFASFFKFMAAYLSLTHLVTAARPLWCV